MFWDEFVVKKRVFTSTGVLIFSAKMIWCHWVNRSCLHYLRFGDCPDLLGDKKSSLWDNKPPSSLLAEVSHDGTNWRRETSAGFRRVSYHACPHVSLATSGIFVTCDNPENRFEYECERERLLNVSTRSNLKMDQPELKMKRPCERPLSWTPCPLQVSKESQRGEF